MTTVADTEQWRREQAAQAVDRFVRRFDESYRLLAYHAALPLVLTPELVHYLRNEFLRGEQVPWVAEVDLLLSDLCSQVGYELYAMDTHVRAYLLEQMEKDQRCGKNRMQEVAQVLISYVNYLSRLNQGRREKELEAQRWAAMVYLGDEECKAAACEIAKQLLNVGVAKDRDLAGIRAELARLARITEELSPQLQKEPILLNYARLVQRVLRMPEAVDPTELDRSYPVEGVELRLLKELLPEDSRPKVVTPKGFPPIKTFEFEVATVTIEESTEPSLDIELQPFEYEVALIEFKPNLTVKRRRQQGRCFIEDLGNGVKLEMVVIPGGSFMMGSPEDELERSRSESPQHQVNIKPFCMGKYPVTQVQWQAVAALPQVNRELNPAPSKFKGVNRPVERVSWDDAVEFCQRLSQKTGREYRLPSEAEWEYACRARTTTPFHFGETITDELANYNANHTYGAGVKGKYRRKSTPVGRFQVANAFGLYDMHGNVWEWCADHWHDDYKWAPDDGSAWLDANENEYQILRGGSWDSDPDFCRSANRDLSIGGRDNLYSNVGFRVVCAGAELF